MAMALHRWHHQRRTLLHCPTDVTRDFWMYKCEREIIDSLRAIATPQPAKPSDLWKQCACSKHRKRISEQLICPANCIRTPLAGWVGEESSCNGTIINSNIEPSGQNKYAADREIAESIRLVHERTGPQRAGMTLCVQRCAHNFTRR